MLSVSHAVAYFSSVVKLMILPAEMGRSSSPLVLPVRISGPFVSRAIATCLPGWAFLGRARIVLAGFSHGYQDLRVPSLIPSRVHFRIASP